MLRAHAAAATTTAAAAAVADTLIARARAGLRTRMSRRVRDASEREFEY